MATPQEVKANILKLVQAGAPEEDVDAYVQSEGFTAEQLKQSQYSAKNPNPAYSFESIQNANIEAMPWHEKLAVGAGRGFSDVGQGIKQISLGVGEKLGLLDEGSKVKYERSLEDELRYYNQLSDKSGVATLGRVGGNLAATAPTMLIPGAQAGNAARLANAVGQGALASSVQYTPEGQSRLSNAVTGGLLSGGASLALGGAAAGGKYLIRGAKNKFSENLAKLQAAGAEGTAGLAQQGRLLGLEGYFSKAPGSVGVVHKVAEKLQSDIGGQVDDLAKKISSIGGSDEAGTTIQKGIEGFKKKVTTGWLKMNSRVDSFFSPTDGVALNNTMTKLDDLLTSKSKAGEVLKSRESLRVFKDTLKEELKGSGGIYPYDMFRSLRTDVGQKLGRSGLVDDVSKGEWKAIYKALNDDLMQVARNKGPVAVKAVEQADKFYSRNMNKLDDIMRPVFDKAKPEDAFNALWTSSRNGPTLMRTLRGALSKDEWADVQSTFIDRLGKANPASQSAISDKFSTEVFLTNWNHLMKVGNTKTLKALLGGNSQHMADMKKIAEAAQLVRANKVYANPSQSGLAAGSIGTGGVLVGGIGGGAIGAMTGNDPVSGGFAGAATALGFMLANNRGAVGLTSPKFANLLAQTTKFRITTPVFLSKLNNIIRLEKDPEAKQDMQELYNGMSQ